MRETTSTNGTRWRTGDKPCCSHQLQGQRSYCLISLNQPQFTRWIISTDKSDSAQFLYDLAETVQSSLQFLYMTFIEGAENALHLRG
jgi:hypothetical protein